MFKFLRRIFRKMGKPEGNMGKILVGGMNAGHAKLTQWAFSHIHPGAGDKVLDIGCGGGAVVARFLDLCPSGEVTGIDISDSSLTMTERFNKKEIEKGRCHVLKADVMNLPFEGESFDCISAFETIYFWPDLTEAFREVRRVLRPGGVFVICNEFNGLDKKDEKWKEVIDDLSIYTQYDIVNHLSEAGFTRVKCYKHEEFGWIMILCGY